MDLVDWDEDRFARSPRSSRELAEQLEIADPFVLPISALHGDNVVDRSERTPWYDGPPLLEHLEPVDVAADRDLDAPAPADPVGRPPTDGRAPRRYVGQLAGGHAGASATRSSSRPPARRRRSSRSTRSTTPSRSPCRRCRSPSSWPTTSTSAAATCSSRPATCRPPRASWRRSSAGWREEPLRAGAPLRAQAHDAHRARDRAGAARAHRPRDVRGRARAGAARAQRHRPRHAAHQLAPSSPTPTPSTASPARSSSSTSTPTTRSAPASWSEARERRGGQAGAPRRHLARRPRSTATPLGARSASAARPSG